MNLTKYLISLALLVLLIGHSTAVLVDETNCSYIDYQNIPYMSGYEPDHVLSLFDPSQGILVGVEVR